MLVQNQDLTFYQIPGSQNSKILVVKSQSSGLNRVLKINEHNKSSHILECEQLSNEAQILFGLDHPNIIKPLSYHNGSDFMLKKCCLLELPFGKTDLFKFITQKEDELLIKHSIDAKKFIAKFHQKIFFQLASAVNYLHNQKDVAHNDIKLANVFISEDDNCLLGDFGFAFANPSNQTKLELRQKWSNRAQVYMAPELLQLIQTYEKEVDNLPLVDEKKADIFNLGLILYEQFFKSQPNQSNFGRTDLNFKHFYLPRQELKRKIFDESSSKKGIIKTLTEMGFDAQELINLIIGMMDVNPEARFTIKQVLNSKFFQDL